jgi:hypothetical protein
LVRSKLRITLGFEKRECATVKFVPLCAFVEVDLVEKVLET